MALELFARQGFAATTVRQIGAAAEVSDSAIYGHFAGKQAMYDALFSETGPLATQPSSVDVDTLVAAGPRAGVTSLVTQVWNEWSRPRARRFLAVMLRDGGAATGPTATEPTSTEPTSTEPAATEPAATGHGTTGFGRLSAAIELTRDQWRVPFERWQREGAIRTDLPARQLVWELFAPLQVPRILYLSTEASDADLAAARQLVADHVGFFLASIIPADFDPPRLK